MSIERLAYYNHAKTIERELDKGQLEMLRLFSSTSFGGKIEAVAQRFKLNTEAIARSNQLNDSEAKSIQKMLAVIISSLNDHLDQDDREIFHIIDNRGSIKSVTWAVINWLETEVQIHLTKSSMNTPALV